MVKGQQSRGHILAKRLGCVSLKFLCEGQRDFFPPLFAVGLPKFWVTLVGKLQGKAAIPLFPPSQGVMGVGGQPPRLREGAELPPPPHFPRRGVRVMKGRRRPTLGRRPKEADFNQRKKDFSHPRLLRVCQGFGSHSWAGCKRKLLTPCLNFSGGQPPLPPGGGRAPSTPTLPSQGCVGHEGSA